MEMPIGKEALRDILRNRRWSLSSEDRMEKSRVICNFIKQLISPEDEVMVYCSKEPEVDTSWLIEQLLHENIPVIVPIIQKNDKSLRLSYLDDPSCLVASTFHVPEPMGNEIPADPSAVTVAIIPMLGFDRGGCRIGYGAGYYDRFLAANRQIRNIGIAYSCLEQDNLPIDENDIMMDIIVTEEGIIRMRGEKTYA